VSYTFSNTATVIVITSGTGTGTLSAAATINSLLTPATGFRFKIRAYVTAGVAGSLLATVTQGTVTDATSQQAQYVLDGQSVPSFNMGLN
jgi:hypothetical protein